MEKRAVVLLSGGLDSAVTLYLARKEGYECHCLAFDYGQRHKIEIVRARSIAAKAGARFKLLKLDISWVGSSLVDKKTKLPVGRSAARIKKGGIPSTYVPARNTVFLSLAVSFAEATGAKAVFIGAHHEDSSGYPDCRKEYLEVFNDAVKLGTKAGTEHRLSIKFPLIDKTKSEIISLGASLGVPFEETWSCYKGGKRPCGRCDSCVLRARGFKEAGIYL